MIVIGELPVVRRSRPDGIPHEKDSFALKPVKFPTVDLRALREVCLPQPQIAPKPHGSLASAKKLTAPTQSSSTGRSIVSKAPCSARLRCLQSP